MDLDFLKFLPVPDPRINSEIYFGLPPEESQRQLQRISETRIPELLTSHIICLLVAYIAVALRFVSRRLKRNGYHVDDWLMLGALVVLTALFAAVMACQRYGLGRHAIIVKNLVGFVKVTD